jgi:hypothetical protein
MLFIENSFAKKITLLKAKATKRAAAPTSFRFVSEFDIFFESIGESYQSWSPKLPLKPTLFLSVRHFATL